MYLKRLEIHGFKSFAQKTTLEFSSGVIAIVGPNGSGKSNIADCLRWVLGEQSAKLIRGKKSDDVIFAGSDKKVRLGFAEVTATFDNADRRIPVDASEVAIGRRVDRSGESEYLLNGNKVRLLDIIDLVLKSNIGTSRYTVIGQGTIDQMILAGPGEVKNLLDEASGVKNYYIKREKTLRRLEQTAQNLMRAEDLIAEIEPRLKSLRRQAKKMEARAEIEQELKVYQRELFGNTFWQLRQSLDAILAQLAQTEGSKKVLEEKSAALRKQVETLEAVSQQGGGKFKAIQDELAKLQSQKNKLLEDLSLVRGKMQSQKTVGGVDAKTLQSKEHELANQLLQSRQAIAKAEAEMLGQQSALKKAQAAFDAASARLNKLYEFLQNPNTIDWEGFSREMVLLENSLNDFYSKAQAGRPWQEVAAAIENFRAGFGRFKGFVGKAFHDPQASANLQSELKKVLREKEDLTAAVQTLELDLSKSKITLEFLQKDSDKLASEKLHVDLEIKKSNASSPDEFWQSLLAEETKIKNEADVLAGEIGKLESLMKQHYSGEEARQKELRQTESAFRDLQDELSKVKDTEGGINVEKAKLDTQMQVLAEEVKRILGEAEWATLQQVKVQTQTPELEGKIARLKNQLDTIGGMDELTLKEYQETEARYTNLSTQVEDLRRGMTDLRQIIDELDEHIKKRFNESFHKINEKFEYYFRVLFNGGRAYLSILKAEEEKAQAEESEEKAEDDSQPGEQLRPEEKVLQKYEKGASNIIGIDIKATPPGKKLATIQALSGGERALTSIALLCSLLACFPSPFVVLDEVDAALDDANTIRFGQILGTLAHQTQFVTITHNRETMAQAHMLYGVTMGDDGISKLLSVKLEQAKAFAK